MVRKVRKVQSFGGDRISFPRLLVSGSWDSGRLTLKCWLVFPRKFGIGLLIGGV
jgi:hypothetical protein